VEYSLIEKLTFITEKYNVSRLVSTQRLAARLASVSDTLQHVERVRSQLGAAIFDFKKAMIEKIKIPFYIYSGKILQHFQQGYGIFVDVRQNTNRIRFLADDSSDHDAIHQLSTGQLAVVSTAFCLALNKVYTLPSHFKFLAIDDPVQTLDDINIYSLVDLIRHEFPDYQLLISTHDENVANFIKYKFEKFSITVQKLNVQSTFYESQNT
jgi:exonuclease SbcC